MRIAAVVGLICTPVAAYLALEHPIVFPYGLYLLLMPYDVLLVVHSNSSLTKALGEATGLFCLFYCLRVRRIAPLRWPLLVLVLLLLWMSLGTLWSADPEGTLQWLQSYFGLALLYAALALTPVPLRDFRFAMGMVAVGFAVAAVFGLQTFHHDPSRSLYQLDYERVSLKFGDTEIDQNHFANAFLFPIAILVASLLRTRWLAIKSLCVAGIALMVAAMMSSGSREAFLGLGAMFVYFLWRGRDRVQVLAVTLVCAFCTAPFAVVLFGRFARAFTQDPGSRTSIWAVGGEAFKHYWLAGSGLGTFPDVYDRFYLAVAQLRPEGWERPAHNVIIHYSVELGIVGAALIVCFVAAHFIILRGIGRDHPLYDYRVMAEAGLIGIVVVSCFIDLFNYKYAWLVFASAAQVAHLATAVRRAPRAEPIRSPHPTRSLDPAPGLSRA